MVAIGATECSGDQTSPPSTRSRIVASLGRMARSRSCSLLKNLSVSGPQHMKLWCDEIAAWKYPNECWEQAEFGLRLGAKPQTVITTTPEANKADQGAGWKPGYRRHPRVDLRKQGESGSDIPERDYHEI
jgi:phage terminase large subunit-like protein